jgi:cell division protease FtsH
LKKEIKVKVDGKLKPARKIPRNLGIYLLALALIVAVFVGLNEVNQPGGTNKDLSTALSEIRNGQVDKVSVSGNDVTLNMKDGSVQHTKKEPEESFTQTMQGAGIKPDSVQLTVKDDSGNSVWLSLLFGSILPILVMVLIFYFLIRQARAAGDNLFAFGKSKAKLFSKDQPRVRFDDVAGVEEAKDELTEVVEFLKTPQKFAALGAKIPKGVLLVGPAGVGKTLLARAVAGEAAVPFFSIAGSEFMEMLVGVGASRVRDLFENAKRNAPAIIFIDEVDSIGRQRGLGLGGGHDEREQTLNQILVEMDGFEPNSGVIVMAATNRPDMLDPALVRPGRFDRRVVLDLPDIEGRKAIIAIHARNKPVAKDVDMDRLARRTVGFSGADLENMLNEAAIRAARLGQTEINESDLEEAALKVKLGPERKRLMSEEDRLMTAYHEGGHAVVTNQLPGMDPVHSISIVSRGMALGFTMIPPATDRYNETKTHLLNMVTSLLGGRAAEEIQFKEFTVGASNDIERATQIARQMVTKFGMSSLGPVAIGFQEEAPWVAREMGAPQGYSDELAGKVDAEVSKIIDSCFNRAKEILEKNKKKLDNLAHELMKKETLTGSDFETLMVG